MKIFTFMKLLSHRAVEVFKNIWTIFNRAEILLLATSLAFSSIFALVPMIALFMAVSKVFGNFSAFSSEFKEGVLDYLTAGAGAELVNQLSVTLSHVEPMGMGVFGLVGLLFTSMRMIYDLDTTIVRVWNKERTTKWWTRGLTYLAILALSPLALTISAGVLDWSILNQFLSIFVRTTSILLFVSLFLCFKFAPPKPVSKRAAFLGALFTYVFLVLGKETYIWVTSNIFSYDYLYGSLAFLPLFLFWLFMIWCFILCGFTVTKAVDDATLRQLS